MRGIAAVTIVAVGVMAAPLGAQGRGRTSLDRIPPGHMPPAGACRVWYDGVPPGQQPAPMSCRDAERIVSRSREARVVYSSAARDQDRTGAWSRDARNGRYESRYPSRVSGPAWEQGYSDGLEKGREDGRDRDSFDPVRHGRYRSADHGYERRFGSKDDYKLVYRDGFEAGYRDGYGRSRRTY